MLFIILGSVHKVCRREWGEQRVLQIFQKIFRSPGDHKAKYSWPSSFFVKKIYGHSHQFCFQ